MSAAAAAAGAAAHPGERADQAVVHGDGIAPLEGGRLLLTILDSRHPGQVAVEPGGRPVANREWAAGLAPAPAGWPAPAPALSSAPARVAAATPSPNGSSASHQPLAPPAAAAPPAGSGGNGTPGRHGLEDRLRTIWADAIGTQDIDVSSDFFDLGGTSLSGVGMMTRIRETFGVELPIAALFDYPTVASMAGALWEQGAR